MKKLCLFAGDITRCGGTEAISVLLANELAAKSIEIIVVSLTESNPETFFPLNSKVKHFALFKKHYPFKLLIPFAIFKLRNILKKEKITHLIDVDVILSAVSVFARKGLNCKLISWEHFHFYENLGCRFRDFARKLAKRYADHIVVLTERDRLQYMEKMSKAAIRVIPDAIIKNNEIIENMPEIQKPFILSVGRLTYQKGFDRIPEMAAEVLQHHPEWKWIIIGDGEQKEMLEKKIADLNLTDKVILAGRQNPSEYYKKAEFLVMPSRYEGFGMVLIEAMNEGCPAVAFDCKCGPSDIVEDGRNGYLIAAEDVDDMKEKISNLIKNPEILQKMSDYAPESVEKFSVSEFVRRWEELLNE